MTEQPIKTVTAFIPSLLRPYLAAAGLLVVCGCNRVDYRIDLVPKGDEIERRLVISISSETAGKRLETEAERIAPWYAGARELDQTGERISVATSDPKRQRAFVGIFQDRMPADLGGQGTYLRLTNQMGTTHAYVERLGRNDDLASLFQEREKTANLLARLVLGWCEQEFGQEPGIGRLREFISKHLARDILNLSLYASWAWKSASQKDKTNEEEERAGAEQAVRAAQYLFERDYFTIDGLSRLACALERDDAEEEELMMLLGGLLGGVVGRKMGLPDGHAALGVFTDLKRLEASWDKFLATTPEYKELLAEFEKHRGKDSEAERPQPMAVLDEVPDLFDQTFSGLPVSDTVTVRLQVPCEPYATNGQWDQTTETVQWPNRILDQEIPAICFAFWSEPNTEFQTEHFGSVILDREDLAAYAILYRGLSESEAADWEKFIGQIKRTEQLAELLDSVQSNSGAPAAVSSFLQKIVSKKTEDSKSIPPSGEHR